MNQGPQHKAGYPESDKREGGNSRIFREYKTASRHFYIPNM